MFLTSTFNKTNFVDFAKTVFIPGQSIHSRSVYFLVGENLITANSKWTKAQNNATGGKGSTTRFRLNGKAISANDLKEFLASVDVEIFEYSSNVYELKTLRTERLNAPAVELTEDETPKVFAVDCVMICIINKLGKINVMKDNFVTKHDINKKSIDSLLSYYFEASKRAEVMIELIKNMDDNNKTMMFL